MNTTEGNKLIAEFMGHKIDWGFNKDSILYMPQGKGNATNNSVVIGLDKLEFHTSWDWLMPVVRKIAEISCNEDEDAFLSDEYTSILDIVPLAIIEDAYRVVVEFIKWYNERYICGCCGENCNEYTYNEEKDIDECNKCK